ncbi:peptide deformylase [Streptomyces salinarius]|uniref:peptide deformylase n=1 Tax=Streptomyces salinarius TaxID=2762598 RepID=UPI003F47A8E9
MTVETTSLNGATVTNVYQRGLDRLVKHEIDHLDGLLYTDRMQSGVLPIRVEEYRQTGRTWAYDSCPGAPSDDGGRGWGGPSTTWGDLCVRCPRRGCMTAAVRTVTTTARRRVRHCYLGGFRRNLPGCGDA